MFFSIKTSDKLHNFSTLWKKTHFSPVNCAITSGHLGKRFVRWIDEFSHLSVNVTGYP